MIASHIKPPLRTREPGAGPPRMACLLGKPPRPTTVLSEVLDRLRAIPAVVTVYLPKGDTPVPASLFDAHLVIHRGLGLAELTSALRLEHAGVRCCNRIAAAIAVRDRMATLLRLGESGVPVPATWPAATWMDVLDSSRGQPVVVKAADGSIGRGRSVLITDSGSLPRQQPFAGPYVVQEFIRGDGQDYKVYVAGPSARGLVKHRAAFQNEDALSRPFEVDAELSALSGRVRLAVDLEIYGFDVLYGPTGPVVIDVNPFPGFRGVRQAAEVIADYLSAIAMRQAQE